MKKFQYNIVICTDANIDKWLNDCGNDGWELINVIAFQIPKVMDGQLILGLNKMPIFDTKFKCFFKREII